MNSREKILSAIKKNKPEPTPLPEVKIFEKNEINLIEGFKTVLQSIGGAVVETTQDALAEEISNQYADCKVVCSLVSEVKGNLDISQVADPHELANVDLAIVKGKFGVAENGAIWLTENDLGHRAIAFITQHLAIILDKNEIVGNMHHAYQRVSIDGIGYGVFLAGPSKTADIEQSLVIGAHGARSLTVYLV
ncbi:LutC/YkgG family protein [Thermoflexibacter ruber]|uniref:L-lactate dehydrogenase complex protein LldG n=1 Tax=Thermoflexibacter ruber TaxID=1003 RepID=A0A1I2I275_9BACT|nr:LUD domain-containing protein [Thermoflexibacter ruber]SFF35733.1 L-lactate dehydrogenase complex protein LldG [Thermoflexibacter ruber]